MNLFNELCIMFVPGILVWHIFFIFFMSDGRYQKYRVRKSLENIHRYQLDHKGDKTVPPEVSVTFKNRNFKVGVIKTDSNRQYSTYRIFINGEEAGVYHRLEHCVLSSYYFEEQNHRMSHEVVGILHAASKKIKREERTTTEKPMKSDDYSYFK